MSPSSRGELPIEDSSHAMILGEMRGQLREMVHGLNNLSSKFDGLSREVIGLAGLAKDVIEIKTQLAQETKDLREEINSLKRERDQRTGAANLVSWGFKNWPGVVGFFALIVVILRTQGKL